MSEALPERLRFAKTTARMRHTTGTDSEILRVFYMAHESVFFSTIDAIKETLNASGFLLQHENQELVASDFLLTALQRVVPHFVYRAHLAIALVEMGARVHWKCSFAFVVNCNASKMTRALHRAADAS